MGVATTRLLPYVQKVLSILKVCRYLKPDETSRTNCCSRIQIFQILICVEYGWGGGVAMNELQGEVLVFTVYFIIFFFFPIGRDPAELVWLTTTYRNTSANVFLMYFHWYFFIIIVFSHVLSKSENNHYALFLQVPDSNRIWLLSLVRLLSGQAIVHNLNCSAFYNSHIFSKHENNIVFVLILKIWLVLIGQIVEWTGEHSQSKLFCLSYFTCFV